MANEKQNESNEAFDDNKLATCLAFMTVGLFLLFARDFLFNRIVSNSIAIFISGVSFTLLAYSTKNNAGTMLGSSAFILTPWGVLFYLSKALSWPIEAAIPINIVGLVFIFVSAALFWTGLISILKSIKALPQNDDNKNKNSVKGIMLLLTQLGSLVLLLVQIVTAIKSL